jgi:plastocyanin
MTTIRRYLVPVAVVGAAAATAVFLLIPAGSAADNPTLEASVGANDAFVISLNDSTGAPVVHIAPGTYTIHVNDQSALHSFHLFGTGVDQATTVEEITKTTWTVTFTDGTYKYQCDAHPSQMHGSFTVGTPPPPPPPPPPVGKNKLVGKVGPGFSISLKTSGGKAVKTLKAGKYTVTVQDLSNIHDFHLIGPGVNKKTSVSGKGTFTWKVTFKKGKTYKYHCDVHPQLKGSFRAT